ncbi:dihydroorotate dehydrogenase-like protein [Porphyromonas macacae]|uniref:dihydrouracil dehydrogenase (NAD(+)) n=1 Tax=Porphyromonas macacae TaxID=28115 RepID=A0A379DIS9_9PORP|nr:dihydroorotate dehydrogenase-like protein [Porphyromonas macacae]SUB78290.1 NAD-dependent dihydropyrimidine dehydrogenase subunit PreA [Porphyromonas macacae]
MIDLTTNFAGLRLSNPVIAGSSGLTRNLSKIKELTDAGIGAVVLKSLFEEQIEMQGANLLDLSNYPEAADYISNYVKSDEINNYLNFIREVKREVSIPVIASINCYKSDSWVSFAKSVEEAGADALEVNMMRVETDLFGNPTEVVDEYVRVTEALVKRVSIPVIVKLSRFHVNMPALVDKLRAVGAKAVTLVNRAYQTDVDIDNIKLSSGNIFTDSDDLSDTLRFTGLVTGLVGRIDVSASTGVHEYKDVVKCLLVGATTVQMCSAIYQKGAIAVKEAIEGLEKWMKQKGYYNISEFRGKLNAKNLPSVTQFERMQFMKYFSNRDK